MRGLWVSLSNKLHSRAEVIPKWHTERLRTSQRVAPSLKYCDSTTPLNAPQTQSLCPALGQADWANKAGQGQEFSVRHSARSADGMVMVNMNWGRSPIQLLSQGLNKKAVTQLCDLHARCEDGLDAHDLPTPCPDFSL